MEREAEVEEGRKGRERKGQGAASTGQVPLLIVTQLCFIEAWSRSGKQRNIDQISNPDPAYFPVLIGDEHPRVVIAVTRVLGV